MPLKNNTKIAFIGAGNMAEALVQGIVRQNMVPPSSITVTDVNEARLGYMRTKYGVQKSLNNVASAAQANIVILAVKPQFFAQILDDIKQAYALNSKMLVISIAAGISTERIESSMGSKAKVIRVMPNTPALVGKGAAAVSSGSHVTPADMKKAVKLLSSVGVAIEMPEEQIDAVTALSGSGPAYVFYLMEAMINAAEEMGIPVDTARALTLQTLLGSAELCRVSGESPAVLREKVTSKGGTTAAALAVFEEHKMGETIRQALIAARDRSLELSKPAHD
ncbi:MAG: pyrroline-5-carboxylate reductase [Spartobacteria bacterium]|nr:pyrroline-5-carboxylate reductase [Spartobacteria bacterium]